MPRIEHEPERVRARKHAVQARSQATVEALLEGAAQVFERRGYAETTTDLIAERAGISIGSLYQYFPNKDAMLLALLYDHLAEGRELLLPLLQRLDASDPPPLEATLRELVHTCVELNGRRPKLHRVLFHEAPHPVDFVAKIKTQERELAEFVGAYLASCPDVTVSSPILAAHMVFSCLESLVHEFVIDPPEGFDPEACEEELFGLLHRYLTG